MSFVNVPKKMFDRDNIYPFHFFMYSLTGFWKPLNSPSKWKKNLYEIYHYIVHVSFVFLMIILIIDAFLVAKNVQKLSTNLCSTITCSGSMVKIWILMRKRKQADQVRENLENNLNISNVGKSKIDQEILMKNSRVLAKITVVYYALGVPLVILWITFPLIDTADETKKFPVPLPIPNITFSPVYEVVFVYIALNIVLFLFNVLSYDMIFYGFLIRICAQFEILAKNIAEISDLYPKIDFERMVEGYQENSEEGQVMPYSDPQKKIFIKVNNVYGFEVSEKSELEKEAKEKNDARWRNEETMKLIEKNIIHHRAILQELQEIDDIFNGPVFLQMTCGAALLGVVAYGIVTQSGGITLEFFQRLFYVGCALFDLLFFCYFGTQVAEKSNHVGEILYDSPWYEMDPKAGKLCLFIIAKLQKVPVVTAGKMFPVTLKTYLQLLRNSYNMIAILRQTKSSSKHSHPSIL